MASSTTPRMPSRLSCRFALKHSNKSSSSASSSLLKSTSSQSAAKRTSSISRLPVELSDVETMMPLHSAIASARLTSSLSIQSRTWGSVPQEFCVGNNNLYAEEIERKMYYALEVSHCLCDSTFWADARDAVLSLDRN